MYQRKDQDEELDDSGGAVTFLEDEVMMNPCLSWEAKGLYAFLGYSYEDWSIDKLVDASACTREEVDTIIDELIKVGYLKKV